MSNPFTRRVLTGLTGTLVGAMICLGATTSPAHAHAIDRLGLDGDVPTVKVSYADLDLANSAGRAELNRRITHAAHEVCAYGVAGTRYTYTYAQRECVRHAIASATLPAGPTMTGSLDEKRRDTN